MKVERYLADDMRQAMKKVRDGMGENALILSNRRINGQTEIVAAVDKESTVKSPSGISIAQTGEVETRDIEKPDKQSGKQSGRFEEGPSLAEIRKELSRLRKMFEGELSQLSWREMGIRQPNKVAIQTRLERAGLNTFIGNMIAEKVTPCDDLDEGWKNALKATARSIQIPESSILEEGGVIALLGSAGVGKTVTAAKIAAQFAARYGENEVALVSTDHTRTGGKEQLLSYGSNLGIAVQFANSKSSLEKTLTSLSQKRLIIIDSAGISWHDTELAQKLEEIFLPQRKIHACLVLSATTQEALIHETIKAFSRASLHSAVITHTDECCSLGPVLSNLIRHQLPLSLIGTGPCVPEDLMKPDNRFLLGNLLNSYRKFMKEQKPKQEEAPMEWRVANA